MNLEDHLRRRLPHVVPRHQCECCRRTMNVSEMGNYCLDCIRRAYDGFSLVNNSRREGLSTPIEELPDIPERTRRELGAKKLDALAELIRKT